MKKLLTLILVLNLALFSGNLLADGKRDRDDDSVRGHATSHEKRHDRGRGKGHDHGREHGKVRAPGQQKERPDHRRGRDHEGHDHSSSDSADDSGTDADPVIEVATYSAVCDAVELLGTVQYTDYDLGVAEVLVTGTLCNSDQDGSAEEQYGYLDTYDITADAFGSWEWDCWLELGNDSAVSTDEVKVDILLECQRMES